MLVASPPMRQHERERLQIRDLSLLRLGKSEGGDVARPRAADDFTTIRARMEELRRERAQAARKDASDAEETRSGGRSLLRASDLRQRFEQERGPAGSSP